MSEPITPRAEATPQPMPPDAPAPAEPPRLRQADLWTADGRHVHVSLTADDGNVVVSGHQDSVLVPVDELFTHADDRGGQHVTYQRTEATT